MGQVPMAIVDSAVDSMPWALQNLHNKEGERIGHYMSEFRSPIVSKNNRSTWLTF
jgi:hypothetical protein